MTRSRPVILSYILVDPESDPVSLSVKYSTVGASGPFVDVATPKTDDDRHDGIVGLTSSPTGVAHKFIHDLEADLGDDFVGQIWYQLIPTDTEEAGAAAILTGVVSALPTQNRGGGKVAVGADGRVGEVKLFYDRRVNRLKILDSLSNLEISSGTINAVKLMLQNKPFNLPASRANDFVTKAVERTVSVVPYR